MNNINKFRVKQVVFSELIWISRKGVVHTTYLGMRKSMGRGGAQFLQVSAQLKILFKMSSEVPSTSKFLNSSSYLLHVACSYYSRYIRFLKPKNECNLNVTKVD